MSDFNERFAKGLNTMQHQGGPVPTPRLMPQAPSVSSWQLVKEMFGADPQAAASQDVPSQNIPPSSAGFVDPYQNLNNRIQGKPYK